MNKFKFLEHTADVKFQAFGSNLSELFANSAFALKEAMTEEKVKEKIEESIFLNIDGKGPEGALHDFLEELLFLFETRGFLLSKFRKIDVREDEGEYFIEAEIIGDKADKYKISDHVKAVTYNDMFVNKEDKGWVSQVVLDV